MTWLRFATAGIRLNAVMALARGTETREGCRRILQHRFATFADSPPSSGHAARLEDVLDQVEAERAKMPKVREPNTYQRRRRRTSGT